MNHPLLVSAVSLVSAAIFVSFYESIKNKFGKEKVQSRRVVYGVLIIIAVVGILGSVVYFGQAVVQMHELRWY